MSFESLVPRLIEMAKSVNMTSKHAAALVCGKRVIAFATNYSTCNSTGLKDKSFKGSYACYQTSA